MKPSNSPPEMHEGTTYVECLDKLAKEAERYGGEFMPVTDKIIDEHPLHYAVRLVESWQEPSARNANVAWRRLPGEAGNLWGRILRACRSGKVDMRRRKTHCQDYGIADPKEAVRAAKELAGWARKAVEEIERLAEDYVEPLFD